LSLWWSVQADPLSLISRVLFVCLRLFVLNKKREKKFFFSCPQNARSLFSLTTPQYSIHFNVSVKSVQIPAHTGAMVVLSKHIPTIAQLKPGVVTVTKVDGVEEKYFVSGGYAFMHPDNSCSVNTVEAIPLSELDVEAAKAGVSKYESLAREATNEEDKALAAIGLNVHQALVYALQ
jgi:F-type H+-transporting ATPase subunit delta